MTILGPQCRLCRGPGIACPGIRGHLVALVSLPPDKGPAARLFRTPPVRALAFVGLYSYSIYLWHVDIPYRIVDTLIRAGWLMIFPPWSRWPIAMTFYVLLAVGVGVLTGRCIEGPFLVLRDRFFQSKVGTRSRSPSSGRGLSWSLGEAQGPIHSRHPIFVIHFGLG